MAFPEEEIIAPDEQNMSFDMSTAPSPAQPTYFDMSAEHPPVQQSLEEQDAGPVLPPNNVPSSVVGPNALLTAEGTLFNPESVRLPESALVGAEIARKRAINDQFWSPGAAAVPDQIVPQTIEGGVEDLSLEERANLADRERALARDKGDIDLEDNELREEELRDTLAFQEDQIDRKRAEASMLREHVRRDRQDLDDQMTKHRELIAKGLDPWRSFGGGSPAGKISAALSLATMSMAGEEYGRQGLMLLDRIINTEVENQKYALETQGEAHDNAYKRLRDSLGDSDQAEAALEALLLDGAKTQMQILLGRTGDAKVQQSILAKILEIDQRALEVNDRYAAAAADKTTYRFIQGRAGYSGGWVTDPVRGSEFRKGLATTANVAMDTAGRSQDIAMKGAKAEAGPDYNVIYEKIPNQFKAKADVTQGAIGAYEAFVKMLGFDGINMETGELIGRPKESIAGVGMNPLDGLGDEGQAIQAAMEKAVKTVRKADSGLSLTGTEQESSDIVSKSWSEGGTVEKTRLAVRALIRERDAAARVYLSEPQMAAWKATQLRRQSTDHEAGQRLTD
jgi:hypothetical protein